MNGKKSIDINNKDITTKLQSSPLASPVYNPIKDSQVVIMKSPTNRKLAQA